MELTRKDMLKLGTLGSAALMIPVMRPARTKLTLKDRLPESRLPRPFEAAFATPPVLRPVRRDRTTDYYQITMKAAPASIIPGFKTQIWGYNGITPGPTIKVMQGRKTVVRQISKLPKFHPDLGYEVGTSVHLHGSASKPQYDGYANDVTKPGQFKDYHYPNFQNARTLWYHDHGVHTTGENAYMGLAAQYHLHDRHELSLPIPHGKYDVPLILKDAVVSKNGQLIYDDQGQSTIMGDLILVNGRPWPVMRVERRKYRFRILNAGISRSYNLALSTGEPLHVIAQDGGLAPRTASVDSFRIGMAERFEIIIDFARYKVGQKVILQNLSTPNNQDFSQTGVLMRFDVVSEARDNRNNSIPKVLNPKNEVMKLKEADATPATRRNPRRMNLVRDASIGWSINGRSWHDIEDSGFKELFANPKLNDVEIWEIVNVAGGWFHPLHIHLIDFKILDRNGEKPHAYENGPKDVVYAGEGETIRIIARFGPHKGRYMIHCHNLVHEDHDMMTQYEVGRDGPDPVEADPARLISRMKKL